MKADYIVFGHFYGECVGEACVETYKLTDSQLFEDTSDVYPFGDKSYPGRFELLNDSLFHAVKSLGDHIPTELLASPDTVFGMPDGGDWGGIYFERSEKGIVRFWLIDKMRSNNPDYLNPFVDKIEAAIDRLSQ
ncbi:MAG TPA: hypothetical protein VFH43_12645 [Candidatus Kapabacteria bacterium]|nr:hypothetical protein [Candidatus Kapabacteria bacterium]